MPESYSCEECPVLSFPFRDRRIPVTYVSSVTLEQARTAIQSDLFATWYRRCEKVSPINNKRLELHSVCIQSIDCFGARKVGFIKIISDCTYFDGVHHLGKRLPGICFLRGDAVSILVALFCDEISDDGKTIVTKEYAILVEQPRVPIGAASILELPAGMIDDENESVAGTAVKEIEEECGIVVRPSDLIDLTELAFEEGVQEGRLSITALPPSAGGCDEFVRYMYLEKKVTVQELNEMNGRLSGLRDHGEYITLSVVPMSNIWKKSGDSKAIISLFLLDQLRKEGKLPSPGKLATSLKPDVESVTEQSTQNKKFKEPIIKLNDGSKIPQLGYGLYQVTNDGVGEQAIFDAITAGYRHFDGAAYYGNEIALGNAIRKSGIPRNEFYISTKVWNDSVKAGRTAVRASVIDSINKLDCDGYVDLCYIHWPVPDHFIEAYHELESLYAEGKIRAIGLSNFSPEEYERLVQDGLSVLPVVNQLEVSPVMYRPQLIEFFRSRGISVVAFKPLNRGRALETNVIQELASRHSVSTAQIMLKWCVQKGLIVICKTSTPERMVINRSLVHFSLNPDEITTLDGLTTDEARLEREQHELNSKNSL